MQPKKCQKRSAVGEVSIKKIALGFGQHARYAVIPFAPVGGATLGREMVLSGASEKSLMSLYQTHYQEWKLSTRKFIL